MRHRLAGWAAFAALALLSAPVPVAAQGGDAAIVAELVKLNANRVLQLAKDVEQLRTMYQNLELLTEFTFREYLVAAAEGAGGEQSFGDAISYSEFNAKERMFLHFPASYHPTIDSDLDAEQLAAMWGRVERDTYAGALGAANLHFRELAQLAERSDLLQDLSRRAVGNMAQAQIRTQWSALQLEGQLQTNSLLQSLLNTLAVQATSQNAVRSHAQEVYRQASTGWLGGSVEVPSTGGPPPEAPPLVPESWPFPVWGAN